jgi:hypothetical protein
MPAWHRRANISSNVYVPSSLSDGDQPITASYNGLATQAGAAITVPH